MLLEHLFVCFVRVSFFHFSLPLSVGGCGRGLSLWHSLDFSINLLKDSTGTKKTNDLETWYTALETRILTKCVQIIFLGWLLPSLQQCQICSVMLLYGK